MLSIAFFGVVCEVLTEEEDYLRSVSVDHFSMTWQEAEAADLVTPEDNTQTKGLSWSIRSLYQPPKHVVHRRRKRPRHRRKRTAFSATEFAELSDGRRVDVRSDRGFGWSWKHSPGPFHNQTVESFTDETRHWFMEYEEDEPTPPEWFVERFQRLYGIEIDPASVQAARRVPLRVELGPRLLQLQPQQ